LTLRDGSLVLRGWTAADGPALAPVCGDPDVCRFTSVPWEYSPDAARQWVERQTAHHAAGTAIVLAVVRAAGGPPVGTVNLGAFSDDGACASLGYWLLPTARGQGLATRSAWLLCDWGLEHLGLERIELAILPENVASQSVAERLGARPEGMRPPDGRQSRHDPSMVIYAISKRRARSQP
jgi:ribosomal-protein-alanine N-acetyltransferase